MGRWEEEAVVVVEAAGANRCRRWWRQVAGRSGEAEVGEVVVVVEAAAVVGAGAAGPGGGGLNAGSATGTFRWRQRQKHPDGTPPDQTQQRQGCGSSCGDLVKLTEENRLPMVTTMKSGKDSPPLKSYLTTSPTTRPVCALSGRQGSGGSITYEMPDRTDAYRTGAGIVTASPCDRGGLVSKNLPGGWRARPWDFAQLGITHSSSPIF